MTVVFARVAPLHPYKYRARAMYMSFEVTRSDTFIS